MVNKRGQELSIGTIILIILGLAVLVFLIIGFTKGWDFFFGNIGRIDPGKLEAVAQACKGYVDAELTIAYCTFRDVGGDEYVNCEDERIKKVLSEAGLTALGTCTNKEDFCNGQGDGRDKLVINNGDIKCASYCGGTATACDKITDSAKCGDSDTTGQLGCKWVEIPVR